MNSTGCQVKPETHDNYCDIIQKARMALKMRTLRDHELVTLVSGMTEAQNAEET